MNWRTFGMAAVLGAVLFVIWLVIGFSTVRGTPLYVVLTCAALAAGLVGYIVWQIVGQGAAPPWDFILIAVLLGLVLPGLAVLHGSAPRDGETDATKAPTGPVAVKDEGEKPAPDGWKKVRPKDVEAILKETAENVLTGKLTKSVVKVVPNDTGGADIILQLVDGAPRVIPTGIQLKQGESCDISAHPLIPGLQVGGDFKGDVKWCRPPAWEFRPENPFNYVIATVPHSEILLRTTERIPPGTYVINITRSPFRTRPGSVAPGIPADRVYLSH